MKTSILYSKVFEPEITALAPRFACRSMMMTREGEIRVYGCRTHEHENGEKDAVFIRYRSLDNGLSFTMEEVPADDPGASTASPWDDGYLTMHCQDRIIGPQGHCIESHAAGAVLLQPRPYGVYVYHSKNGADGPWEVTKISDRTPHLFRLPLPLKKWKRWINVGQLQMEDKRWHPVIYLSDAEGKNWTETILPAPPAFELTYPHKGMRWVEPGVEPSIAETPSGRLLMLLRTSRDVHYECYSDDGGVTWSGMKPSIFYSVATMPGIYSLSDGRMIAIWNNTCPLPELDHDTEQPMLSNDEKAGVWEDVFTNRDAIHAAISDDEGKTWTGFREIVLNPVRNNSDFRTNDGSWYLNDKSVHQNQLLELPGNKVLLHCGQHIKCSLLILFDLDFLKVKERKEDFAHGLNNWSTHLYYKSYSGGCRGAGHCSWNRRTGAQLMPSPENDFREALLIGRHPDDRLYSDREGAVWNFPGCCKGSVTADFTLTPGTAGLRVSLADRWINPCDEYVSESAPFSFVLDGEGKVNGIPVAVPGKRSALRMDFDLDKGLLTVSGNDAQVAISYGRTLPAPFGKEVELSYLHLQTAATSEDTKGVYLHYTEMKAK